MFPWEQGACSHGRKALVYAIADLLTGMEKAALERWNNGDPSGFPEISHGDEAYFDPMQAQRLDGLDKLTALCESIRGKFMWTGMK